MQHRARKHRSLDTDAAVRQKAGASGPGGATAQLLALQRTAGNQATGIAIQRVKDLWSEKLGRDKLLLASAFRAKHVADDEAGAQQVTHARYVAGKMPAAMVNGRMSNTVATSATWLDALDTSASSVNTQNEAWTKDVKIDVKAWQVRFNTRTNRYDVSGPTDVKLVAGGYAEAIYAGKGRNSSKQVTDGSFLLDHIGNG